MVGVAQSRDPHGTVLEILKASYLFCSFRTRCEGKERQSPRRGEAGYFGAVGKSLKRNIKRRPRIIHRATDQRLHGDIAAAGIYQPHIESFLREMAARPRHLVGNDT